MRIQYFDPMFQKPDFGLNYDFQPSDNPFPQQSDPSALLKAQRDAAEQDYYAALQATAMEPQQMQPPPRLNDTQLGLGAIGSLLASVSGRPGQYDQNQMFDRFTGQLGQAQKDKWAVAQENIKAQRDSELRRRQIKAEVARMDYEDKAREHGMLQKIQSDEAADKRRFDREMALSREVSNRQGVLANRKLQGDPEAILTDRYNNGEITKEEWLNGIARTGPSRAAEMKANTAVLNEKAKEIIANTGLIGTKKDELVKKVAEMPQRLQAYIAVQYARVYKLRQAPAGKTPQEKTATVAARRTAINGLITSLDAAIKEVEATSSVELLGVKTPDYEKLVPLWHQKNELQDELDELNRSVVSGKATAP